MTLDSLDEPTEGKLKGGGGGTRKNALQESFLGYHSRVLSRAQYSVSWPQIHSAIS